MEEGDSEVIKAELMGILSLHGKIEGEKVEAVTDFILLGSKITVDGDCSHESKKCLLLGTKTMTNLNRDIPDKAPSSQSYGFSSSHVWK